MFIKSFPTFLLKLKIIKHVGILSNGIFLILCNDMVIWCYQIKRIGIKAFCWRLFSFYFCQNLVPNWPPMPLCSDGLAALPLPRVSHFFKSKIHYSCNYGTWPSWSISFLFSYIVAAIATGTYRGRTDKNTMVRSDMTSSYKNEWIFNETSEPGNISNLGF